MWLMAVTYLPSAADQLVPRGGACSDWTSLSAVADTYGHDRWIRWAQRGHFQNERLAATLRETRIRS